MLFSNRKELLALDSTVNGTEYDNLDDLYSTRLIRLPNPQFITFYNGVAKQPERKIYRLSDAFERPEKEPSLELIVTQLNINPGYNQELIEKCPSLYGYMCYVEKIRQYRKLHPLDQAVRKRSIVRTF